MALFWVFAELFIITFMLKGISFLVEDGKKHHGFILSAGFFFIFLIFITFFRGQIYSLLPTYPNPIQIKFYSHALWQFYCSQWLVFEAGITLYILRIYALMKQSAGSSRETREKWRAVERITIIGVPGFLVLYALFYAGYQILTFSAIENDLINKAQLFHIHLY